MKINIIMWFVRHEPWPLRKSSFMFVINLRYLNQAIKVDSIMVRETRTMAWVKTRTMAYNLKTSVH